MQATALRAPVTGHVRRQTNVGFRGTQLNPVILLAVVAGVLGCNPAQEWEDARVVASRVHSQLQARDHAAIYRESAPRFKGVGTEAQFVALMQQFHRDHGSLKRANEMAYETGLDTEAGKVHVLTYDLELEKVRMRERLILTRSETGQMQLWKLDIQPIQ